MAAVSSLAGMTGASVLTRLIACSVIPGSGGLCSSSRATSVFTRPASVHGVGRFQWEVSREHCSTRGGALRLRKAYAY
jgi:hypothetical protein